MAAQTAAAALSRLCERSALASLSSSSLEAAGISKSNQVVTVIRKVRGVATSADASQRKAAAKAKPADTHCRKHKLAIAHTRPLLPSSPAREQRVLGFLEGVDYPVIGDRAAVCPVRDHE